MGLEVEGERVETEEEVEPLLDVEERVLEARELLDERKRGVERGVTVGDITMLTKRGD